LQGIEIVPVEGKNALNEFVELQYTLYRGDPHFVPQPRMAVKDLLNREKHPFYITADVELYLAKQDGKGYDGLRTAAAMH